jgi:outer membrane receptor protein involved in Fe transport
MKSLALKGNSGVSISRFRLTATATAIAGAFSLFGGGAFAQGTESITVTGSRIQALNLSSAPIIEISSQDIKATGLTRLEEILNSLPQLIPDFGAFDVNPGTGQASVNLRGLGSQRTLVLVNGHRLQPGGLRDEAPDINQIPVALIKRIEVLTGGASAVYGSDAMAGVVNIILDDKFEGFSISVGKAGYQHDNRNTYLPPLMDLRKFSYPSGNTGIDGVADTIDIAWGGKLGGDKGHAMAYYSFRKNDALLQGERDYTSCALNLAGTACGGSGTAPNPSFLIYGTKLDGSGINGDEARISASGKYEFGLTDRYNFAPINHYQIPNERHHFGGSLGYRVNDSFSPYFESMVTSGRTSLQIAESGTFYNHDGVFKCSQMGTLCVDLGLDPSLDQEVYVGKRNKEGGPRTSTIDSTSFRTVIGSKGSLFSTGWDYNASYLLGKNRSTEANTNDFVTTKLDDALRGCPPGSFKGCIPYNVWAKDGVTVAAADALSATGLRVAETSLKVFSGYVTGELPFKFPSASNSISLAVGLEQRETAYYSTVDENMATGNFTGLGGPRTETKGSIKVTEFFAESAVPLYAGKGTLKSLNLDVGLRSSKYERSGQANTFKLGANADFGLFRARASYNEVIRAPSVGELFSDQTIALWNGTDPCAGAKPTSTAAECALTGVSAAQYGKISASPASQYNQFGGGDPSLNPEKGQTVTFGLVFSPTKTTSFTGDFFSFKINDRIGAIGASTILSQCIKTADPQLCNRIKRRPGSGDLWVGSDPATSGYVINQSTNLGSYTFQGFDLGAYHSMKAFGGNVSLALVGTVMDKAEIAPFPGINDAATYDCVGKISPNCSGIPKWKHSLTARYSVNQYSVSMKWRHGQGYDYVLTDGKPGTQDKLVSVTYGGKLPGYNYIDLSGSYSLTKMVSLSFGINNLFDKEPPLVGDGLAATSNVPAGGYDQVGRYLFANVNVKF